MRPTQWHEKNTIEDRIEDDRIQKKFKLQPIDFIDSPMPRSHVYDRNEERAEEYFNHGRIDGKKVCNFRTWDREVYTRLRKGTYDDKL